MENITWIQINDYPKYEISNMGQIRTIRNQRLIKPYIQKKENYYIVTLCKDSQKKNFMLSRLVAEHFLENPNQSRRVVHIDEKKFLK